MPAVQDAPSMPSGGAARRAASAVLRTPQTAWQWSLLHPWISASLGFLVLATVLPLLAVWVLRPAPPDPPPINLQRALDELDHGHVASARDMVFQLQQSESLSDEERGGPSFVQGVIASREADSQNQGQRRRFSLLAARYLMEARDQGFPPGREAEGLALLGKNLFRAGQLEASQEALEEALPLQGDYAGQIHRMLCDIYLNVAPPKFQPALEHLTEYLKLATDGTNETERAVLDKATLLFKLGRWEESRQAIADLPATSPLHVEGQILAARIRMAEVLNGVAADTLSPTASETLEALAKEWDAWAMRLEPQDERRGAIGTQRGICLQRLGRAIEARKQYAQVQQEFPHSLESLRAGFHEAELLQQQGSDDDAVQLYQQCVSGLAAQQRPEDWATLDDLRVLALRAYQHFFDAGEFQHATELLVALTPLLDARLRLELSATAHRAWGEAVLRSPSSSAGSKSSDQRRQAESIFRTAGQDFARLAELRFSTREYPDDLWASSECYLLAHRYYEARQALLAYLHAEPARRRPLALVRMGECLLLENQPSAAIESLEEAFTTAPLDSAIYRGRILASQAYLRKDDTATAEKMLLENLNSELLTPASLEWRDSLFALGKLYFLTNQYSNALKQLEQAVRRYPESPESVGARYQIGESYRQQARDALQRRDAALVESARNAHAREARTLLESAVAAYDAAAEGMESRRELAPAEAAVLRNCRYMKAAALFDLGRYEEAIATYSTAINQYQHAPEVLDAYVRVADCFRRLQRPVEARGTIQQAKVVLGRLPPETDFTETSSLDRQEWQRYLEWLGEL